MDASAGMGIEIAMPRKTKHTARKRRILNFIGIAAVNKFAVSSLSVQAEMIPESLYRFVRQVIDLPDFGSNVSQRLA